jgi:hypothetical protein
MERHLPLLLVGLGVLTLALMLFIFLRVMKSQNPPVPASREATLEAGATAAQMAAGGATAAAFAAGAVSPELKAPSRAELEEHRALAIDFASKDPAGAALILTRWLGSGDEQKPPAAASPAA